MTIRISRITSRVDFFDIDLSKLDVIALQTGLRNEGYESLADIVRSNNDLIRSLRSNPIFLENIVDFLISNSGYVEQGTDYLPDENYTVEQL
jgi:hypothetical protein